MSPATRYAPRDRLRTLCQEFGEPGQDRVVIEISMRRLAERCGVGSPSTMIKFFDAREGPGGPVLDRGRSWIVLDATHPECRTPGNDSNVHRLSTDFCLSIEDNDIASLASTADQSEAGTLVERLFDALVVADQTNDNELQRHLRDAIKRAVLVTHDQTNLEATAPPSNNKARETRAQARETRDFGPERAPSRRAFLDFGRKSNPKSTKSNGEGARKGARVARPGARKGARTVDVGYGHSTTAGEDDEPANESGVKPTINGQDIAANLQESLDCLPEPTQRVVVQCLTNGLGFSSVDGRTEPWERPSFPPAHWDHSQIEQVTQHWDELFDQPLSDRALAAMQLWSPEQAVDALNALADTGADTKNPGGRLVSAAVFGYHQFFPEETIEMSPEVEAKVKRANQIALLAQKWRTDRQARDDFTGTLRRELVDLSCLVDWQTSNKAIDLLDRVCIATEFDYVDIAELEEHFPWDMQQFEENIKFVIHAIGMA